MGLKMKKPSPDGLGFLTLAEWTGLEPATPGVTGRYSNQLNYHSAWCSFALLRAKCHKLGDPTGIRTPVLTVKG
ncbi:MAG: hypothetical protein RLZZ271_1565 [Pseudomonadota bacterium]